MNDNKKALIVNSLEKEEYEVHKDTLNPFFDYALSSDFEGDSKALNQVAGSVGALDLKEYEGQLLKLVARNNLSAAFVFLHILIAGHNSLPMEMEQYS